MASSEVKETLGTLNEDSYVNLLTKLIGESKHVQNNPPELIPQEDRVVKHVLDVLLPLSTKTGGGGGPLVINQVTYFPGRGNLIVEYPGTEPGKESSYHLLACIWMLSLLILMTGLTPFYNVADAMKKLQGYVDDINENIQNLETRGPVSKYVLTDENMRGTLTISFDKAHSGVACSLDSRGFHVLCKATEFTRSLGLCLSFEIFKMKALMFKLQATV